MFTETELIDALRHSARRADDLDEGRSGPAEPTRRDRAWTRFTLPAVAAASVLAVAVGAVAFAGIDRSPAPAAGRATTAPTHPAPTHSVTTHSPSPTPIRRGDEHVPVDISGVLDPVQITGSVFANWSLGDDGDPSAGSSSLEHPVVSTGHITDLTIVGPDAGFDPDRIPRDQPVQIDGTTGYYGKFTLLPLDGNASPYPGKYLPSWMIAFRTPDGDWAFAEIEKVGTDAAPDDVSVDDPSAIVAAYDDLGVSFVADQSTVPLRTGYLPDGMRLVGTSFATGRGDSGLVDATLADGANRIDIQLTPVGSDASVGGAGCGTPAGGCHDAYAVVGGYEVEVGTDGYDASVASRVLHTLHVVADAKDTSSYWTLAAAFG